MRSFFVFFLYAICIFGAEYDCIFVGTSPIPLFEALYQHAIGKSVLILDDAPTPGGVWKSIDICGVKHVDVGCHEIGNNEHLREFLEIYGGCKMLFFDTSKSFYFSGGCYELIRNLENRIANSSIKLLLGHQVDRAIYDPENECMIVQSNGKTFTGKKIYTSSYCYFPINDQPSRTIQKWKYYHLYLLINDPTPPRFSYQHHGVTSTSRMMNLTHFNDLASMGRQLIVFQAYNLDKLNNGEKFVEELKSRNLLDPAAFILHSEQYIHEQWPPNNMQIPTICASCFEQINTFDIRSMNLYIRKWKEALLPYNQAIANVSLFESSLKEY